MALAREYAETPASGQLLTIPFFTKSLSDSIVLTRSAESNVITGSQHDSLVF